LKAYRARKEVRAADKNHILHALWVPNDTHYKLQWHFNKPDFIYAEQGWDVERGEPKVVVAIIDTGAAYEDRPVPSSETPTRTIKTATAPTSPGPWRRRPTTPPTWPAWPTSAA